MLNSNWFVQGFVLQCYWNFCRERVAESCEASAKGMKLLANLSQAGETSEFLLDHSEISGIQIPSWIPVKVKLWAMNAIMFKELSY